MKKQFEDYFKTKVVYGTKLVDTTNDRFNYMIGYRGSIGVIYDKVISFQNSTNDFTTSYVVSMIVVNNTLCVTTRNSKYWFELPTKEVEYDGDNPNEGIETIYVRPQESIDKIEKDILDYN